MISNGGPSTPRLLRPEHAKKENPPGVKGALSIKNVGETINEDTRVWGDE